MNESKAVILAGGMGKRMRRDLPKQFIKLLGKPIFVYTLEIFDKIDLLGDMVLVVPEDRVSWVGEMLEGYDFKKKIDIVSGGLSRQESSYEGLKACGEETSLVVIHDAARPFVSKELVERVVNAANESRASSCAIRNSDTVAYQRGSFVVEFPPREGLVRIQTPQAFDRRLVMKAHKWALENQMKCFTDDCGMVFKMGEKVFLVEGSELNIKITEPEDLVFAERKLSGS